MWYMPLRINTVNLANPVDYPMWYYADLLFRLSVDITLYKSKNAAVE